MLAMGHERISWSSHARGNQYFFPISLCSHGTHMTYIGASMRWASSQSSPRMAGAFRSSIHVTVL